MGEKFHVTKNAQKGRLGMRILIENNRLIVDYFLKIIDNRLCQICNRFDSLAPGSCAPVDFIPGKIRPLLWLYGVGIV